MNECRNTTHRKEGKAFPASDSHKRILKKPVRVDDTTFLAIHESLVLKYQIEEGTWIEEIPTSQGIFLKMVECGLDENSRQPIGEIKYMLRPECRIEDSVE